MNSQEDLKHVEAMSTVELLRYVLDEAQKLAKAELRYAQEELRSEIRAAKRAGVLAGAAVALALCGLAVLFGAVAVVLPMPVGLALLLVGLALIAVAAALAYAGYRRAPKEPMRGARAHLKRDLSLSKERLA